MICTEIVPRVSETDGAGHINNVFVPVWFEAGRREIFRVLNPDLKFDNWHSVLASIHVDYCDQIFYEDSAQVRTWIERVGNKSFTVGEEIWQGHRCCAKGQAVYVYYDLGLQASQRVPDSVRQALLNLQK